MFSFGKSLKTGGFLWKIKKSFSLFLFQLNLFYFANQEMMAAHLKCQILSFTVSANWVKTALNLT